MTQGNTRRNRPSHVAPEAATHIPDGPRSTSGYSLQSPPSVAHHQQQMDETSTRLAARHVESSGQSITYGVICITCDGPVGAGSAGQPVDQLLVDTSTAASGELPATGL